MNYGYALKSIRTELKMQQQVAAEKAKISQTYLSQLESNSKNEPSKKILSQLAKVYGVPTVIIIFRALEESDVPKGKKHLYKKLNPVIQSLISEVLKK